MLNTVYELRQELYGNHWTIYKSPAEQYCRFCNFSNEPNGMFEKHKPNCPRYKHLIESGANISTIASNINRDNSKYVMVVHNRMGDYDKPYDNGGHPMNFGDR